MEKIKFTKQELVNLGFSLQREWLLTSGSGAFATSSLSLCNTRKYHGLLIVRQPQIDNEWHLLLSSLDETIVQGDNEFHLALHHYQNDTYYPKGHKYLQSFQRNKTIKLIYNVGDVQLEKDIIMPCGQDRVLVRYHVKNCTQSFAIRFAPLLAFRQRHRLTVENSAANTSCTPIACGESFCLYDGYDSLCIQFSKAGVQYNHLPQWYKNFQYIQEAKRGYDCMEDLLNVGYFETKLKKGDTIIVSISTKEEDAKKISSLYTSELRKAQPIEDFDSLLCQQARQFFIHSQGKTEVFAGFPWFGRWGRDTFIALPGLCNGLQDTGLMKEAINTMIADIKGGLFPNIGSGQGAAYNSVDAPLWFFYTLQQYSKMTGKTQEVWKEYKRVICSILTAYKTGESFGIHMADNGLIWAGVDGKALTWMDAIVNNNPVTQRRGFCVEVNALWYNALMFSLSLAQRAKDKDFIAQWQTIAEEVPVAFKKTFWDKNIGWLADYVDGYYKDFSVRPNMILATSLPYTPISEKIRQLIVERIEKELLIPYGLRTLSPTHLDYKGVYEGSQQQRDMSYHQGTAWTWLLSHFVSGYLRIYGKEGLPMAQKLYSNFEDNIRNYGIGGVAEVFDATAPYRAGGCPWQAWSVSAVIMIGQLIKEYSKEGKIK